MLPLNESTKAIGLKMT